MPFLPARFVLFCACMITAMFAFSPSVKADVLIIQNGKANAQIVVAREAPPMVLLAATELQRLLEEMSGAKLEIVNEPTKAQPNHLYVGSSRYTHELDVNVDDLTNDAFRIKSGKNWLVLAGADKPFQLPDGAPVSHADRARGQKDWEKLAGEHWVQPFTSLFKGRNAKMNIWEQDGKGSINAVYAWLRILGAEWYMPGEIGQVMPHHADIQLPEIDLLTQAYYPLRSMMFYGKNFFQSSQEEVIWQLQMGLNRNAGIMGIAPSGHGITWVIQRDEFAKEHPDYFALFNNNRAVTGEHKPCLSSPGLFQSNINFVNTVFKNYDVPSVGIMPPDGYTMTCQCELCKGKATLERGWRGQISDYVWTYVNNAAKEIYKTHPDKFIISSAYGSYSEVPLTIDQMSPNLRIAIVQARREFNDNDKREAITKLRNSWLEKLPKGTRPLMTWDHHLWAREKSLPHMPVYQMHAIDWDLKASKNISQGDFTEVYRDKDDAHMIVDNINLFVTARLLWNPDLDVDKIIDTYCTNFYGPAAEPVKQFMAYSEANWMLMAKDGDKINEMFKLLQKVQAAAPPNTIYGKRVAMLAEYLEPMRNHAEQLTKERQSQYQIRLSSHHGNGLDVVMDGKLDEPTWNIGGWRALQELETGKAPAHGTKFKIFWRNETLYLGIVGQEPGPWPRNAVTINDDPNTWTGDCVELLLETQANSYYQIAITPSGKVMDVNRDGGSGHGHPMNPAWSANMQVVATHDDQSWTLEIAIPMADERAGEYDVNNGVAGRQPTEKFPWYLNICRTRIDKDGSELSAFSPTGKRQFHVLDKLAKTWVK